MLHEVITTERVPFTYRVAGVGSRFLAWLIDAGVIALLGVAALLAGGVFEVLRQGLGMAVLLICLFVLQWGYFLFFEWLWHGQTPGKRVMGIRVVHWQGTSIMFYQAAVRNVLRVADSLPWLGLAGTYGLGFVSALCNREQRRLGDLAAGTLVVHVERKALPIRALSQGVDQAAKQQEVVARRRLSQLTRDQKQTLIDLCLRREQLRVSDRALLFRAAADCFRERLKLSPEEYQSDEKFVLQMVALLGERGSAAGEIIAVRPTRQRAR